jgi:hypothetical protein
MYDPSECVCVFLCDIIFLRIKRYTQRQTDTQTYTGKKRHGHMSSMCIFMGGNPYRIQYRQSPLLLCLMVSAKRLKIARTREWELDLVDGRRLEAEFLYCGERERDSSVNVS